MSFRTCFIIVVAPDTFFFSRFTRERAARAHVKASGKRRCAHGNRWVAVRRGEARCGAECARAGAAARAGRGSATTTKVLIEATRLYTSFICRLFFRFFLTTVNGESCSAAATYHPEEYDTRIYTR